MTLPQQPIRCVRDVLAFAVASDRDLAARYRSLATLAAERRDPALAQTFEDLADTEERQSERVARLLAKAEGGVGSGPVRGSRRLDGPRDDEARAALAGPYQAFVFAVRNAERLFVTYTYVSAHAEDEETRTAAEDLARVRLRQASELRRLRRRAYRADRPAGISIPSDVASLRDIVRQWESRTGAALIVLADRLAKAGRGESAEIVRRAASAEQAAGAPLDPMSPPPVIHTIAEGTRLLEETFDRLALIGERAQDAAVVSEAQRLSEGVVARLALVAAADDAARGSA